jgi:hypothetical protein
MRVYTIESQRRSGAGWRRLGAGLAPVAIKTIYYYYISRKLYMAAYEFNMAAYLYS